MTWTERLRLDWPIIQAPMAGAQGSELAIAVSHAGALGSLPCAMLGPQAMREELAAIRAGTRRSYNVNLFCHRLPVPEAAREAAWRQRLAPYYAAFGVSPQAATAGGGRAPFDAAAAELLETFRPPVVSFHFGLPDAQLLARVRSWGACIMSSATTVEEARWLAAQGVDIVIVQGLEAGGHRGMFLTEDATTQIGTFALVPQVVQAVDVPVVAAGGIVDAQGVAAAMALGASGVQCGTVYLTCPESRIAPLHREALAGAQARHTALTNVFTGRLARGIVNRAIRELGPICADAPAFPGAAVAMAPLRAQAESAGRADFTPLWAGQNASACRAIPAAQVTLALAQGLAS